MADANEYLVISEIMGSLAQNNVVLYIGKGISSSDLTPELCRLNWRCIVTSRTEADFGKEFATEQRKPRRYARFAELPSNIFDRVNLPIIQIYGTDGSAEEGLADNGDPVLSNLLVKRNAEKIMNHILSRLDVRCRMVVLGYEPEDPREFPMDAFMPLWYEMPGGLLYFFGMDKFRDRNEESGRFHDVAKKCGFVWCSKPIGELLKSVYDSEDGEGVTGDAEDTKQADSVNLFYKGHELTAISSSILLRCRNFAQLLTEEAVYQRRPFGRVQQSIWFYNFLNDSSIAPQWYGYLPQSDFHLKRPFEDILVSLVRNIISAKSMYQAGRVTPVILEGDSGSSKSITLAALAYRIYNERTNPVVYINNDALLFNYSNSPELEQLDELLQAIELVGSKDMRTLILWDSASYRNVEEQADGLARQLDNRGRRFVLVCTAYGGAGFGKALSHKGIPNDGQHQLKWFAYHDGAFRNVGEESPVKDVLFDGKHYYIQSTRHLEEKEKVELRNKARLHLNLEPETLTKIWGKLKDESCDDIFVYFYRLVNLIRPNLENRLSNEQRVVSSYVNKQLVLLEAKEEEQGTFNNSMQRALQELGITISEDTDVAIREDEAQLASYDLNRFNTCIAMFSRFRLDTPYALAFHMLDKGDPGKQRELYNVMKLFDLMTNDIPWIYYGEDMHGNFIFRFRNSLEAEIFLAKNQIDADRQITLICDMLDYYASIYRRQGYEDEIIMKAVQRLLRMSGPNTDYLPFWPGEKNESEHLSILEKLDSVTEKLSELREECGLPDSDASFACIEITFLREYYGKLWDRFNHGYSGENLQPWETQSEMYTPSKYELRLCKLKQASDLALSSIQKLEDSKRDMEYNGRRRLQEQINSLAVEISYCNTELEKLWNEYQDVCSAKDEAPKLRREDIRPLSYLHQYQMLVRAINTAPTNGYAYNALFNLFEKEYMRSDEETKLRLLSEVRMIADDAMTLEITDRGMNGYDSLSTHIQKVQQYSGGFKVTIESILEKTCQQSFVNLFESMLAKNNASGITFVCQQELDSAGLDGKTLFQQQEKNDGEYILTERQLEVCGRILNFMRRPEYAACVGKDPYALYLMLRVAWMYYNKRPMGEGKEGQLTYIEASHWDDIRQICEQYRECPGTNKRPIVTLLYALSLVQLNNDYSQADRALEMLNEDVFSSTARMRVPYIICQAPGVPRNYSGTVLETKNYRGFIRIDGIPSRLGNKTGVRFALQKLGMQTMPEKRQILSDLELGIGYMGFAVYTKAGRQGGRHE